MKGEMTYVPVGWVRSTKSRTSAMLMYTSESVLFTVYDQSDTALE